MTTQARLTIGQLNECLPHLRAAVQGLHDCWDNLGELERRFGVDIEVDDLSASFCIGEVPCITLKDLTEFYEILLNDEEVSK